MKAFDREAALDDVVDDFVFELACVAEAEVADVRDDGEDSYVVLSLQFYGMLDTAFVLYQDLRLTATVIDVYGV